MQFADHQQLLPQVVVLLALKSLSTRTGAERILVAEMAGLNRKSILLSAARRLDGFDRPDAVHLNYTFDIKQRSSHVPRERR